MELERWTKDAPSDFFSTVTHLWLLTEDGKIDVVAKVRYSEDGERIVPDDCDEAASIHADYWGEYAWETEYRGYYSKEYGLLTCHGEVDLVLERKLARKFREAVYLRAW